MNSTHESNSEFASHQEEQTVALLAALSQVTRLRIVKLLTEKGPLPVAEIASSLDLQQSRTSQHLAILTRAGVLRVEQRKASRFYGLRGPRVPAMIALAEEFCRVHGLYPAEVIHKAGETAEPEPISFLP